MNCEASEKVRKELSGSLMDFHEAMEHNKWTGRIVLRSNILEI